MDALMAEIALKRKTMDDVPAAARPTKYMRRGDIERLKEEQERKEREEKEAKKREELERKQQSEKAAKRTKAHGHSASNSPHPDGVRDTDSPDPASGSSFNISNDEAIRRLRAKGQPIRLFGESDPDRRLRLRALELLEEKEHERHGGQNDFRKALEDVETRAHKQEDNEKLKKRGAKDNTPEVLDLDLVKSDPDKLYPIIYYALKRTLKEWEEWMDNRPGEYTASIIAAPP
ncbi:hypothetical protein QCA50_010947 [Cerrena zonata]|uniref:Pre-mRNA processing factor 4 (PRP4)-like domain-containing protein n=1 Tax=Cerrena zonata TaxID=2478898 RepID=A0AAW0G4R0_9APHY